MVGRGGQPPSKPLCKFQNLNQGWNTVSAEDKLPRRMGSILIWAGCKDLCNMFLCSSPWRQCHVKAQSGQWNTSLCRAASLFNVLQWPRARWFSPVWEFMCGILELTSWGGIFGIKDLGGEVCFKDFWNVTVFSSYGVRELISSFNPHVMLLCLLYSCGKCWRDLHWICLALPWG